MTAAVKLGKLGPFEFNPRGNLWYNDESTFGHKLLAKMGWSKGKGLGKNEDGIKENVKVGKKDNLSGVGYKHDFNISVGCAEYEKILSNLQKCNNKGAKVEETNNTKDLESLEKRSQNSRSRLHYQKFIRGKDMFSRSEKDMKCIFLDIPKIKAEDNSEKDVMKIPTVESALSVNDYFAMKMKQKFDSSTSHKSTKEAMKISDNTNLNKKRKNTSEDNLENKRIKIESSSDEEETKKIKIMDDISHKNKRIKLKNREVSNKSEGNLETKRVKIKAEPGRDEEQSKKLKIADEIPHISKKIKLENEEKSSSLSTKNLKGKKKHKYSTESKHLLNRNNLEDEESTNHLSSNYTDTQMTYNEKSNSISHKNSRTNSGVVNSISHKTKLKSKNNRVDNSKSEDEVVENQSCNSIHAVKSKKKKLKRKHLSKIRNLKSCIKYSSSYALDNDRTVTFNERVSYKLMDTSFESVDPINDSILAEGQSLLSESNGQTREMAECEDNEPINSDNVSLGGTITKQDEEHILVQSQEEDEKEHTDEPTNPYNLQEDLNFEETSTKQEEENFQVQNLEEKEKLPACYNLPKNPSSCFNLWLESQRAALKMDLYKNMLTKMQKHEVFRTTNLLDIKGYGNWES